MKRGIRKPTPLAIQQSAILRSVTNGIFRSLPGQDFATKTQNWGFAENGIFRFQTLFLRRSAVLESIKKQGEPFIGTPSEIILLCHKIIPHLQVKIAL